MCLIENVVPNSVMSAAPNAMVLAAMHGVIAVGVFLAVAIRGRARPRLDEVDAEAVAHHGSE